MKTIQMACNAGGHFRKGFIEQYPDIQFTFYDNPLKKAFFFGCYGELQLKKANSHLAQLYLCWTGGDIKYVMQHPELAELVRKPNITHIAISSFIEEDLKKLGIEYISEPILPYKPVYNPVPLGDSVYIYKSQHVPYGRDLNNEIKRRLPDMKFIEAEFHSHNRSEMNYIYSKCYAGIRLTTHDGLSNTVCEMGMMGRKVIWNGNTPNAIGWTDIDSIVVGLEQAKQANPVQVADDMRDFLVTDIIEKLWI